jgi:hypothetical protein
VIALCPPYSHAFPAARKPVRIGWRSDICLGGLQFTPSEANLPKDGIVGKVAGRRTDLGHFTDKLTLGE